MVILIWELIYFTETMHWAFLFIERECIEFIYCQYTPAVWGVISNTLPLWKKEWQYIASSWDELENTPPSANCLRGRIFQYTPFLGSVLLQYCGLKSTGIWGSQGPLVILHSWSRKESWPKLIKSSQQQVCCAGCAHRLEVQCLLIQ